jgi:hypothetical protein
MSERHDIWAVADALQMDLRSAQAKLVELRARLAALDLPKPSESICPNCQLPLRGPNSLAEHLYTSHAGPLPPQYVRADEIAGEPDLPVEERETMVAVGWPSRL